MIAPAVRTRRARALGLALIVAVTVSSSACNPGRPPAATVADIDIPAERVDDLVAAFAAADPAFAADIRGDGDATYSTAWAAEMLGILINRAVTAHLADERSVIVDSTHREGAKDELARSLLPDDPEKGAAVVDALPGATRAWLEGLVASGLALQADLGAEGAASPEQVRRYYDQNSDQFAQVCLRLLVLAPDGVDGARARLDAGEDFGDLSAELSVVPEVAEARGGNDCILLSQLQQQLQGEAFQEISGMPDGGVAGPFQYDESGNVVLVEVGPQQPAPFEDVVEELTANFPADARIAALVTDELDQVDVSVDPRFGHWDRESRTVVAPSAPGR